ncbi:MAG: Ig-like domain-containing protein, partial [Scrofimicrobium sp.]
MLKVRSARNGEQRSKGGSAKRRLESLFAGLATASLLVTGLAGVAAADPVDETPQSDPAATETTANQGTGDDSVGTSDDAQSSDQDLNNGSDEGVVSQSEPRSNAARSFSPFAAGERNDKVVVRDILLDRVPAGSGQLAVGDTAHISAVWDATEADPKPGEYFTVTLPEEFSFLQDASGFPLKGDDGDGNEQTWANCTLETATRTVTCTFTDVVADWDEIWGTIEFDVKASKATTSESVEIDANGTVEVVDLPGEGGISNPAPLEIVKSGSLIKNNTGVGWSIRIPGQLLVNADQSPVYLYDTLSDSLQLCDPTGLKVTAYKNGSAVSSAPVPTAAIDTISLPDGADFR